MSPSGDPCCSREVLVMPGCPRRAVEERPAWRSSCEKCGGVRPPPPFWHHALHAGRSSTARRGHPGITSTPREQHGSPLGDIPLTNAPVGAVSILHVTMIGLSLIHI